MPARGTADPYSFDPGGGMFIDDPLENPWKGGGGGFGGGKYVPPGVGQGPGGAGVGAGAGGWNGLGFGYQNVTGLDPMAIRRRLLAMRGGRTPSMPGAMMRDRMGPVFTAPQPQMAPQGVPDFSQLMRLLGGL